MRSSLGEFVAELRGSRSQADVAREVGITPSALCALEAGRRRFSDARLAGVLDVLDASALDQACAWRRLFEAQGHPYDDAERMARAKVLGGQAAA